MTRRIDQEIEMCKEQVEYESVGEECIRLYWLHHDTWKEAKAEYDALPFWNIHRRSELYRKYSWHLREASTLSGPMLACAATNKKSPATDPDKPDR
jgi:hypothetical protein